ncbi:hypothetical protein OPIT5_12645 [Opitutaceae bacterium TAV5]|nr:hypothetical protein OPIT5_12645 [Opitutaceae bacterium TAV5]
MPSSDPLPPPITPHLDHQPAKVSRRRRVVPENRNYNPPLIATALMVGVAIVIAAFVLIIASLTGR